MILTSGCFDGIHSGHVAYLKAASALRRPFEDLACAVAPSSYIEHAKGRGAHWAQSARVEAIQGIRYVTRALSQKHESAAELIYACHPRLFVKGRDWIDRMPPDVLMACATVGCRIVFVDTPGKHTSEAMR